MPLNAISINPDTGGEASEILVTEKTPFNVLNGGVVVDTVDDGMDVVDRLEETVVVALVAEELVDITEEVVVLLELRGTLSVVVVYCFVVPVVVLVEYSFYK